MSISSSISSTATPGRRAHLHGSSRRSSGRGRGDGQRPRWLRRRPGQGARRGRPSLASTTAQALARDRSGREKGRGRRAARAQGRRGRLRQQRGQRAARGGGGGHRRAARGRRRRAPGARVRAGAGQRVGAPGGGRGLRVATVATITTPALLRELQVGPQAAGERAAPVPVAGCGVEGAGGRAVSAQAGALGVTVGRPGVWGVGGEGWVREGRGGGEERERGGPVQAKRAQRAVRMGSSAVSLPCSPDPATRLGAPPSARRRAGSTSDSFWRVGHAVTPGRVGTRSRERERERVAPPKRRSVGQRASEREEEITPLIPLHFTFLCLRHFSFLQHTHTHAPP